ncbi:hypothetical protein [Bosea sp. (in: a-proteobacteria)]|uniref:hypothetical protein n=1 Tax=Bosea sp. (in: a-proteobacteria) TaxID=1871050 RepID=UPI0040345ED0
MVLLLLPRSLLLLPLLLLSLHLMLLLLLPLLLLLMSLQPLLLLLLALDLLPAVWPLCPVGLVSCARVCVLWQLLLPLLALVQGPCHATSWAGHPQGRRGTALRWPLAGSGLG